MKHVILTLIAIFILLSTFTGCVMTIAQIQENPQKYAGKNVVLTGEIDVAVNIPFTKLYVFTFKDSTGTVVVFSQKNHGSGDSITLSGTVIAFPEEDFKGESKKSAKWLKDFLIKNDYVDKNVAQGVADIIINTCAGLAGGLGRVFFIKE